MRQLVFALALCFAVSNAASAGSVTHAVAKKATKHKVKGRKAAKAKKPNRVVHHTAS